jgi:Helix-turn-helix domain
MVIRQEAGIGWEEDEYIFVGIDSVEKLQGTPEYQHEAMVETIRCRREEIEGTLPENPPGGAKWKAKQGLHRLNLNGAEQDVMACLIDRANPHTGLCYPSEEYIAAWTGRAMRTVQRAVRTLWDKRLINITRRSLTSNRYYIAWGKLFEAHKLQKAFERRHTVTRPPKVADHDTKSGGSYPPEVAAKPINRTYEHEPKTLSGTSSDAPLKEAKREEKGFQKVPSGSLPANPSTSPPVRVGQ